MILTDKELLQVLKKGIYTKLEDDEKLTHYNVIAFTENKLLICFSGIDWSDGRTWYKPHKIEQIDKNKTWFFENKKEK